MPKYYIFSSTLIKVYTVDDVQPRNLRNWMKLLRTISVTDGDKLVQSYLPQIHKPEYNALFKIWKILRPVSIDDRRNLIVYPNKDNEDLDSVWHNMEEISSVKYKTYAEGGRIVNNLNFITTTKLGDDPLTFMELPPEVQLSVLESTSVVDGDRIIDGLATGRKYDPEIRSLVRDWGRMRPKKIKDETKIHKYVSEDGTKIVYTWNGERHRGGDKPAVIRPDGTKIWYQYGERHRDHDKPAVRYSDGTKKWYQNDRLHRDHGKPAVRYSNGVKKWYQNGELHRDRPMPAITRPNGTRAWYEHGKLYMEIDEGGIVTSYNDNGSFNEFDPATRERIWFNSDGNFHREDGPAITRADGSEEWWYNGEPHHDENPQLLLTV